MQDQIMHSAALTWFSMWFHHLSYYIYNGVSGSHTQRIYQLKDLLWRLCQTDRIKVRWYPYLLELMCLIPVSFLSLGGYIVFPFTHWEVILCLFKTLRNYSLWLAVSMNIIQDTILPRGCSHCPWSPPHIEKLETWNDKPTLQHTETITQVKYSNFI
jgi:hypothetical protein